MFDRSRENRSQLVMTRIRGGRQAIFWQSASAVTTGGVAMVRSFAITGPATLASTNPKMNFRTVPIPRNLRHKLTQAGRNSICH